VRLRAIEKLHAAGSDVARRHDRENTVNDHPGFGTDREVRAAELRTRISLVCRSRLPCSLSFQRRRSEEISDEERHRRALQRFCRTSPKTCAGQTGVTSGWARLVFVVARRASLICRTSPTSWKGGRARELGMPSSMPGCQSPDWRRYGDCGVTWWHDICEDQERRFGRDELSCRFHSRRRSETALLIGTGVGDAATKPSGPARRKPADAPVYQFARAAVQLSCVGGNTQRRPPERGAKRL